MERKIDWVSKTPLSDAELLHIADNFLSANIPNDLNFQADAKYEIILNNSGSTSDLAVSEIPSISGIGNVIESNDNQSNLYAVQRHKILNLKKEEFLKFLGINMFMGYHKLPNWRHYWSISEDLKIPIVPAAMSRDRFDSILKSPQWTLECGSERKIKYLVHFASNFHECRVITVKRTQKDGSKANTVGPLVKDYNTFMQIV
ncbi:hypothetical protein ILUMI_10184 [Ignelater luminosus]|uniref:PiggyBac transposable element-derived protein domain-containing protein n=1 Tax=Ignelater luminosus TaxID=2038154 RepID=A0A8K0D2I8_IGNLU|nr:hypothetical protein ILUMI_10184 [Ignelater luminosus]